jgi:hypothetical protein
MSDAACSGIYARPNAGHGYVRHPTDLAWPGHYRAAIADVMVHVTSKTAIRDKGLTTGVGLWLADAIGVAAGAGMYTVTAFIATLSRAILYGLRERPQQRRSNGHPRAEDEEVPKEARS